MFPHNLEPIERFKKQFPHINITVSPTLIYGEDIYKFHDTNTGRTCSFRIMRTIPPETYINILNNILASAVGRFNDRNDSVNKFRPKLPRHVYDKIEQFGQF